MDAQVKIIVGCLWGAVGIVWFVGALTAKRTARAQSAGSRLLHIALAALAVMIGFTKLFHFSPLNQPFVPGSPPFAYSGVLLTLMGAGIAIWARFYLGSNWSGTVTVKKDHALVRRGPYAFVRHPIYTGLLLALLGTAVVWREVRVLAAIALVFVMLLLKMKLEEKFMVEEFDTEYREYARRVKALIPYVY
jgi:protein-S-isoprenylcysteine O-methyltransferase Ste14